MPPDRSPLARARELRAQKRPAEAEQACRAALVSNPADPDALHLLGLLCLESRRAEEAARHLGAACAAVDGRAEWHDDWGRALRAAGKISDAIHAFRRSIDLASERAEPWYFLGNALRADKRQEEAVAAYRRALVLRGDWPEALTNLGNALYSLRRHDEAVLTWRRALSIRPGQIEAATGLANHLREAGKPADAAAVLAAAAAGRPDHADVRFQLGNALRALGRHEEARAAFADAERLSPRTASYSYNLGNTLKDLGRPGEAAQAYERAVGREPGYAEAWVNLGSTMNTLGRPADAERAFRRAVDAAPSLPEAWHNLGNVLGEAHRDDAALAAFTRAVTVAPRWPEGVAALLFMRQVVCDWRPVRIDGRVLDLDAQDRWRIAHAVAEGASPHRLVAIDATAEEQRAAARRFMAIARRPEPLPPPPPRVSGRITVGYVSAAFRDHATAHLCAGLFDRHDRDRFRVVGYALGPAGPGPMRARIAAGCEPLRELGGATAREVADAVRADGVDVLVDLDGPTGGNRAIPVLFHRPARVQVHWVGYPGPLGVDAAPPACVDWFVGDEVVWGGAAAEATSEPLALLEGCYQPNDDRRPAAGPAPSRAELGLPEDAFVYCSLVNSYKIRPATFDVWARVLKRVPGSCLWLLADGEATRANLRREAQARGIAANRLVFCGRVPQAAHLARHGAADLFLDTHPCGGHTSASDALFAGLPVITRLGDTFAGRVAASVLRAAGLPELVTESWEAYEDLAVRVAQQPELRAELARKARATPNSALYDTTALVRRWERALAHMVREMEQGRQPRTFRA